MPEVAEEFGDGVLERSPLPSPSQAELEAETVWS